MITIGENPEKVLINYPQAKQFQIWLQIEKDVFIWNGGEFTDANADNSVIYLDGAAFNRNEVGDEFSKAKKIAESKFSSGKLVVTHFENS